MEQQVVGAVGCGAEGHWGSRSLGQQVIGAAGCGAPGPVIGAVGPLPPHPHDLLPKAKAELLKF